MMPAAPTAFKHAGAPGMDFGAANPMAAAGAVPMASGWPTAVAPVAGGQMPASPWGYPGALAGRPAPFYPAFAPPLGNYAPYGPVMPGFAPPVAPAMGYGQGAGFGVMPQMPQMPQAANPMGQATYSTQQRQGQTWSGTQGAYSTR